MFDAIASWLADLIIAALSALPDWELNPGTFPFFGQLAEINWFIDLGPVFAVTIAALALGPLLMVTTLGLWGYGLVRGGGNRA